MKASWCFTLAATGIAILNVGSAVAGVPLGPTKLAQQNDKAHSMTRADPPTIRVTDSSSPAYTESQEPLLSEGGRRKRRERSVYGLGYETRQGASGPATGSRLNR